MINLSTLLAQGKSVHLPRYGDAVRPVRDWLAILTVATVLLLGSIVWNVFFFIGVLTGESSDASGETGVLSDTTSVEEVETMFERRALEVERYKTEYRFVDPSRQ